MNTKWFDVICPKCEKLITIPYTETKEKPTAEKFIFENEEEFDKFWNDCNLTMNSFHIDMWRKRAFELGYIRKSELQTLVDEAEEMYSKMAMASQDVTCWGTAEKCYQAFQALKAEMIRCRKK